MKINKDYRKLRTLPLFMQLIAVIFMWIVFVLREIWIKITIPYRWLKEHI